MGFGILAARPMVVPGALTAVARPVSGTLRLARGSGLFTRQALAPAMASGLACPGCQPDFPAGWKNCPYRGNKLS